MAKKRKADHVIMRNGKMFCSHCGAYHDIPLPCEIPVFVAMAKAYSDSHKHCAPVWKEPETNSSMSESQKAVFWLKYGERGESSETMVAVIFEAPAVKHHRDYKHPEDRSDFGRCLKLLKYVPEWKEKLHLMKPVSEVWERLVDNWDKLTAMYEANDKEMYEFMKTLKCIKQKP